MAKRQPSIKALWDSVTKGGQASLQMAEIAIRHYVDNDGAIEKAQQVLEVTKERPMYHKAFQTVLLACLPINNAGGRVKLTEKGEAKRVAARQGFFDAIQSAEFGSILEMVGGKKQKKSDKSAYAKASQMLGTVKNIMTAEDANGSAEELITLMAMADEVAALAKRIREAALALGVQDLPANADDAVEGSASSAPEAAAQDSTPESAAA